MNPHFRLASSIRWIRLSLALVFFALAVGCGKAVKLVSAGGRVEIGGVPAEGIMVQFLPEAIPGEQRPSSFATTESDGTFSLVTQDGVPGAVVGPHTVILVDTLEERPEQGKPMIRPPRLNSRYATVLGGMKATVTEAGEPIILQVSEKP